MCRVNFRQTPRSRPPAPEAIQQIQDATQLYEPLQAMPGAGVKEEIDFTKIFGQDEVDLDAGETHASNST
jgi:hypothetical protein